jgi:hypothetical protein
MPHMEKDPITERLKNDPNTERPMLHILWTVPH